MTPTKQRALVTALIGLGLLIVGFFGIRTVSAFREFRNHRPPPHFDSGQPETDAELIRDWMTIPFIGKMYHLPPPVLFEALNIPMHGNLEKSLKQLNDEYFPDSPELAINLVKAAVQANVLPPSAIPPPTAIPPATSIPATSP
jgi:hypothetical protein